MALLPPEFLNNVVALGVKKTEGQVAQERENERQMGGDPEWVDEFSWFGSGFLVGRLREKGEGESQYGGYLVTNRHVLEGHSEVAVRQRFSGGKVGTYTLTLTENGSPLWQTRDGVDVAVAGLRLGGIMAELGAGVESIFRSETDILTRKEMQDGGLTEGDGVFVLGYPMGLLVKGRRDVVVRRGSIARIQTMYDTKMDEYWIDSSIFPGNSGGPVLSQPEIAAAGGTTPFSRCCLIGIVQSYVQYRDVAVSQQTGNTRIIFEENSGLASVIPMDAVMDLIESMEAKRQ